tara:strand:- start:33 stop:167 length:135 start_codon:yes stop_codon:yes gene_type:complete
MITNAGNTRHSGQTFEDRIREIKREAGWVDAKDLKEMRAFPLES